MARGLRVVAGEARGVPLIAPEGARPTAGRVREALFSSLGELRSTSVLDLYAGSGALGIEALSRGAARAVFVDADRAAADAIEANLVATRLVDAARVCVVPVTTFVRGRSPAEAPFGLVLADPPYGTDEQELVEVLDALAAPGWLTETGRVVLERATRQPLPGPPPPWAVRWERRYGDTLVVVLRASG